MHDASRVPRAAAAAMLIRGEMKAHYGVGEEYVRVPSAKIMRVGDGWER